MQAQGSVWNIVQLPGHLEKLLEAGGNVCEAARTLHSLVGVRTNLHVCVQVIQLRFGSSATSA